MLATVTDKAAMEPVLEIYANWQIYFPESIPENIIGTFPYGWKVWFGAN